MKKHVWVIVVLMICLLSLSASGVFVASVLNSEEEGEQISYDTFGAWTEVETFQTVPIMPGEGHRIGKVEDYGRKDYTVDVNGTTVKDYKNYLNVLSKAGFKKHSDNGEDALDGYVYTAAFTKGDVTIVVSHIVSEEKTYISASKQQLSEHLIYKEEYTEGLDSNAKTTVSLVELNNNGASFVIQLKNGHFVVQDGGTQYDAPYLVDYLESLTPGDEKPIVEAWFISHPHVDHYGALNEIAQSTLKNRLYVNGVYYHAPKDEMLVSESVLISTTCQALYSQLKTEDGKVAGDYRPQLGQRYYFCDIVIDVSMTPEQLNSEGYSTAGPDVNDTSVWLMHHIEGQKFLTGGDASHGNLKAMMHLFDQSYFEVDVFAVLHHGINVYQYAVDYIDAKTLLYPSFRLGSLYSNKYPTLAREQENQYMRERAEESYSFANGTVVLTFPYKVGKAKVMEPCKWDYSGGIPRERRTTEWGWEWDGLRHYYNE